MDLSKLSDQEVLGFKPTLPTKEVTKFTDWKKEPSIEDLKHDLQEAQHSHSVFMANLDKWHNLYDAPKLPKNHSNGSRVNPKLVRKQAEWRCSALSEPFLSTTNLFEVRPMTHEDVSRAKQNALILNMQFNTQLNKVHLVDGIVRRLVKDGTAIVRLGWEEKKEKVKELQKQFEYTQFVPQSEEQLAQIQEEYERLSQLKQQEPDTYESSTNEALKAGFEMSQEQGTLLVAKEVGEIEVEVEKLTVNRPTIEVCNIKNVYIDPTCLGLIDKAQFIIHSYESSLADLKQVGFYKNLDKLEYTDSQSIEHTKQTNNFTFKDKPRKKLIVYEYWGYWDIDGTGLTKPIVASWVNNTLIRLEENPFPDKKLPFVLFNYIPEEDSVYGIPDAELLEDNQAILGAVTRGMIDLLGKSANSQTGYMKGLLDPTNKKRFADGEDYEFNPVANPAGAIYTHKFPEIPNSAMNLINMMNGEAEAISGVKAFAGSGITASHLGDVAVGIRGVLDAVSKREMTILRRLSDGFIQLGRKIISMNGQWLSEEEVVRVTNSEFVRIRRDDLLGKYDLTLTISTAEADDAKAKELAFMIQTMGNIMPQEITQLVLSEIATLRKMPDLAHKILNHQPQPDPIAEQMRDLEMQKLQAEIQLLQAEAQEAMAKSQVQSAKVGVEQAKANNLQSDADNKVLDFVERDSGLTHQRDMQKQDNINQHKMAQQALNHQAQSQHNVDKHNAKLLEQLAMQQLQGTQL